MRCLSYCIAEKIDLSKLEQQVLKSAKSSLLTVKKHRDLVEITDTHKQSDCYIFSNGTLVSWNLKQHELSHYFKWMKSTGVSVAEESFSDEFYYQLGDETTIAPHESFNLDCLTLANDSADLKLSLSYGFSQSIKLKYYESKIEKLVTRYTPLTQELSKHGRIRLPYKRMQRIIGDISLVKGELNLVGDFLYQPKFFWQHPNLEVHFIMLERYLDIPKRTDSLNQQLNTLHEIFLMFSGYLEARSSHNLEIIIVVLIAVEIIFNVLNLHF